MKKRCWCLGLILCLILAGCAPRQGQGDPTATPECTVTATPEPSETSTPSAAPLPDPQEDPKGYILACLDKMLDEEELFLRFWIHPGSGPTPTNWSTAEYGAAVREMFEDLDWDEARLLTWEEAHTDDAAWVNAPGAYNVTLNDYDWGFILCGLNCEMIRVNGKDDNLYFHVDGAEKLCTKLTDMEPSVYVNMGRVRVPEQESREATLKLYLETALERTKELGHITDYELRAYAVTPSEKGRAEEAEHPGFGYTATYAFKPAHPEALPWNLDADGWVEASIEEYTEALAYDARDGCYGMY